jgi:NAD+ synthase
MNDVYKQIDNVSDWLSQYNNEAGTTGYVIGLSGGIDSTLVANLAVKAVGKENVIGVIMPIYSNSSDENDACAVADSLGIKSIIYDMKETYNAMIEQSPIELGKIEKANIRSRLRMVFLYAVAGKENKLVAGTGNKSEDTIGYFTKYGDGGVDVLPIVEFYKWEVKEMARAFGVSDELINRVSTAGLWDGQTDEGELGMSYEEIDKIIHFLETGEGIALPTDRMEKVRKMIAVNKHKLSYPPSYRRIK